MFKLLPGVTLLLFSTCLYAENIKSYLVKGSVSGVVGTVTLQLTTSKSINTTSVNTDGNFSFPKPIPDGSEYQVTIQNPPQNQICTVNNATGIIQGSDINNVKVTCSATAYRIGGMISGLSGSAIVLTLNDMYTTTISNNGIFTLPTEIATGSNFTIKIKQQPANQICAIQNSAGMMGNGSVNNIIITCGGNAHTIGGTVSGLKGAVILQNNGTDTTQVNANGPFTFATPLPEGSNYLVTASNSTSKQTCTLTHQSGIMGNSNITNIVVTCKKNSTTITATPRAVIPVNGDAVSIIVTNTGTVAAENISATLPSGWNQVKIDTRDCVSIEPGGTCQLLFSSNAPYVAQKGIVVTGNNIDSPVSIALAFSVNGYLVWSVDSANTASVIDVKEFYPTQWGNSIITGAQSLTDGMANTVRIGGYAYGSTGIGVSAALFCRFSISGKIAPGVWYLPSICQMGGQKQGAGCAEGIANIDENLVQMGFSDLTGSYWSSTESSTSPQNLAWVESFNMGGSSQGTQAKYNTILKVRCARSINY